MTFLEWEANFESAKAAFTAAKVAEAAAVSAELDELRSFFEHECLCSSFPCTETSLAAMKSARERVFAVQAKLRAARDATWSALHAQSAAVNAKFTADPANTDTHPESTAA